jgi:heme-degrading monooxygenase HmoA
MIVRVWSGVVAAHDADSYARYMLDTGIPGYTSQRGNKGAYVLRRATEAGYEFVMLSLWDSMDHIRSFAGDDPERAVFYPEDDHFLIKRDLRVRHYEVIETDRKAGHDHQS